MLEAFFFLMAFFRVFIYFSIASLSFLIFVSYKKAYCNEKATWIIQSVVYLFLALFFSFSVYTIAGLVNMIEGVGIRYRFLVSLIGFTNLPLFFALLNFFNASVYQNGKKERLSGRVSETVSNRFGCGENVEKELPSNNKPLYKNRGKKKSFRLRNLRKGFRKN